MLDSIRLVMVLQTPPAENGTLQSDVYISNEQDWCYGPLISYHIIWICYGAPHP